MMLSLAVLGVGGVGVAIAHSTEAPWHWYHEERKGAELAGHVECGTLECLDMQNCLAR